MHSRALIVVVLNVPQKKNGETYKTQSTPKKKRRTDVKNIIKIT